MNKKIIIVITSIAFIAGVVSALLVSGIQNQNPKIFCYAEEYETSDWYVREDGTEIHHYSACWQSWSNTDSPVLATWYDLNFPQNFSSLPNADLGVQVFNNDSKSLFNVAIDISYRTTENKWATITKEVGFLDIQQYKQTTITLTNPYLYPWHTVGGFRSMYIRADGMTDYKWTFENFTVYVLNASDSKITAAYGFAKS
jgi:hypothetical protein